MSPFSLQVRSEILSSFPDWAGFVGEETYNGSQPYLVVTVPAPPEADTHLPLRISTWDEEVTVDFDYYHAHFDRWKAEDDDGTHSAAQLYVNAILSESILVASWWKGDAWVLSAQIEEGSPVAPFADVKFSKVRVRSWKGTHNKDASS